MAKRQIKNYVFKPGIGALGSLYPNAYDLLHNNRDFLIEESIAYINNEIDDAVKCQRDIGYIYDGAKWDAVLGTNYNATFLGIAEVNSLDLSPTVLRTIARTEVQMKSLVSSSTTVTSGLTDFFAELNDIIENGRTAADPVTLTVPGDATSGEVAAAQRLLNNYNFLAAEVNAWVNVTYPSHNHDVDKCTRDVKYAINALAYDILYGGNSATYDQAKFFFYAFSNGAPGIDPTHRLQTVAAYNRLQTIVQQVVLGETITKSAGNTATQDITGPSATSTEATALSTLVQITEDVVNATSQSAANAVLAAITKTYPTYSHTASDVQDAYADLDGNKSTVISAVTWSPTYTYNQTKCERDLGYVLDAYEHDLRYGGNEKLRNTIKYYWDQDVAQVDGNRIPEIDTHAFIGDLITDYILTNTAWPAEGDVEQYINSSLTSETYQYTPTKAVYTPTTGKMVLTIGSHELKAGSAILIATNSITFTCELDANATLHSYPRASGVPNDSGTDPYYNKLVYVSEVTPTTITVNVGISSDTSKHTFVSATPNAITASAVHKIDTLVQNTVDVITNGLSSMPEEIATGVGTIKLQGKHPANTLLLITNATKNEIIFNFSTANQGGSVVIKEHGDDEDFVKYEQTTDGVTTITLNYDTSTHSSTDEITVFVEEEEVRTRPYDFGTDAIERMRIAPPMSMLDADFEYGLQPTKWSAIGTLRGYPSVYEIPGTDTAVSSVVTDASAGTDGIGQSKITVTTVTAHGWEAGTPITIKALENSISGAARAEGSFVITTVPSPTTFTFYAKAKVGTVSGQILSTTYTQLRQAGFYTGSSIGAPEFSISSNGSSGTMYAQLGVLAGQTIIPYDGPHPEIGSPLSNASIPTGSQVTGFISSSAGGGTYLSPEVAITTNPGENVVQVVNPTGIVPNLAVDRGDGNAIYVTSVTGNDVAFSGNFNAPVIANSQTYTGVTGTNDASTGIGAEFTISLNDPGDSTPWYYLIDSIDNGGSSYKVGDRIILAGNDLGGSSPGNDATVIVSTINPATGAITAATVSGTVFDGNAFYTNIPATFAGGVGTLGNFDIEWLDNVYTNVSVVSPDNSSGYVVGDRIKILGSFIDPIAGANVTHDLYLTVTGIGAGGGITTVSWLGYAPDALRNYNSVPWTTSGSGVDAVFNVEVTGSTYNVTVDLAGTAFLGGDTITIFGTELGGTSPTNDLTFTVTNVDTGGEIITISAPTGSALNNGSALSAVGDVIVPADATFDVTVSGGVYSAVVNNAGTGYGPDMDLIILGSALGGTSPTNDLTLTVTGVGNYVDGDITTVGLSGVAPTVGGPYANVSGTNEPNSGIGAEFTVTRSFGQYTTINLNTAGTGYKEGNRIILSGVDLDGGSIHDITIRVLTASPITGAIATYTESWNSAEYGSQFDLIATVSMSEETSATITAGDAINYSALATIEIDFPNAHGLVPGDSFIVTMSSDDGSNNHILAAGAYFATEIPTINSLRYQARAAGAIDTTTSNLVGTVYPRPDSFFIHRPYDGGVQLGTGGPQHGAQAIRQSKKYIRYQSGKGIMYTTGALFAPSYDLRSVTSDGIEVGSLITVTTDDNDHGVQVGGVIRLLGIETPGYNSGPGNSTPPDFDYDVVDVVNERTFKVRAKRRLGSTTGVLGFAAQMSVVSWHGATVRSGIFDDQNGIFWEYDGTNISVNQRTGTKQLAGTVSLEVDSNLITGTNTRFRDQVTAGDRIIIKGMTHVVSHVTNDTTMTVTPDWRGVVDVASVKANLVVDKKVKQSDFNLDRLDGTGPSGYNIDPAKMQMIGIQYSWYGAGFIDFMLRGSDGNFVFAHRMRNSNVNTEAFMRSGNLPVRYEVTNEGPPGKLAADMDNVQTTLQLVDASFFPDSGTVYIDNEIINFNGRSGNSLLNLTRFATFGNFQAGADRQYTAGPATTHDAGTGVILISNTITPLISHWGSAFLTDGGFDEDRGYIFSYAETNVAVSTTKQTAFMIRLAPSVSNAIVGDLGERELLNRAQLLLQGIEITSDTGTGGIIVEGILNPQNFPLDPGSVSWSGLSTLAQGGQPSFAQVAAGGGVTWSTGAAATTTNVTTAAYPSGNISLQDWYWQNGTQYTNSGYSQVLLLEDNYNTYAGQGLAVGDYFSHPAFPANTTITGFSNNWNVGGIGRVRWMYLSAAATSTNSTQAATVQKRWRTSSTSVIWFNQTSFAASGVTSGTDVSDSRFPAGTLVNTISLSTYFGTSYYVVSFNNTSSSSAMTPGTTTIEFSFSQPPYAQPGETVFSFIATPGERSELDLGELKELTNTPLGGRGTFPNGPDVLAINVYKVSGTNINANIVLKWGEAQA